MPKTKTQTLLVIIFFILLYFRSAQTQEEYGGNCKNSEEKQSPINIIPPFTFTSFNGEFQFNTIFDGFLENNNSTLKLEGDFGSIFYGNKVFNTYEINFKSPSEHTIGESNVSLPLEIQISSISEDSSRVNIAILFSKDEEDSDFLYTLGFGKGLLQHLKPSQFLEFKGAFSIKEIMPKENKFFIYQGTLTSTPCSSAVWLIAYNTFRISQRQIDDFPKTLVYKRREIQNLQKREIFITFYPGSDTQSSSSTASSNQTSTNETNATTDNSTNKTKKISQKKKIISSENDTISDLDDEISTKSQNKDSFKFLGDTTNYEFDFYGGETAIKNKGIKYIRNEDYLVVYDKEYIKQEDSGNTSTTVTTSIVIDDKVVDEIINSMEKKNSNKTNCLKFNSSNNETNNTSEDSSNNNANHDNLTANLFEKEMFDLWTVEKNEKNKEKIEEFAFKRPEQNKIFLNLNKPISFLQIDQKSDPSSQTANPFFVLTDDMIKNSQKNPIIIDANILQTLLNNPNINSNLTAAKETQNQSNNGFSANHDQELLIYDENNKNNETSRNKMILEQNNYKNIPNNNDISIPTSFVQTKLQGISKERITDEKENIFSSDGENFKHISFDGYFPNEEQINNLKKEENSVNDNQNINQSIDQISEINKEISELDIQKLDESSLKDKSPQEIEDMKQKMKKILKALDGKMEKTKTIVDSSTETSSKDSATKADIKKNLDETQNIVDKLGESQNSAISNENTEEITYENSIQSNSNDLKSILDIPNDEENESLKKLKKIIDNTHKVFDFPGQGKQAVDKTGKWDGIPIFNISKWPDKCKYGSYQSPIHIGLSDTFFVEAHQVSVNYGKPENNKIEMYNDGFKLIVKGMFGSLKYGEHEFPAKEIYIHHPSEHTFGEDQSRTDFEIQILHEDNGARVIVAVFLHDMGDNKKNEFLDGLQFEKENADKWVEIGQKRSIVNEQIDLSSLLDSIPHFISYDGSLTTPPCSEGVKWIILRKRKQVTQKQIKAFQYLFGKSSNVRGTQELGNRKLRLF